MNHYYLLLTQAFAEAMEGHQEGRNVFHAAQTNDGQYVCSANALNEFPEMFSCVSFQVIKLQQSDFTSNQLPANATYTLQQLKSQKTDTFERQTREYINQHYDAVNRDALQMIFSQALATSNTAAAERVGLVMAWASSIMGYNAQKISNFNAAQDQAALDAATWDFSQFDASDPQVKVSEFV